jgi:hypothetical protein
MCIRKNKKGDTMLPLYAFFLLAMLGVSHALWTERKRTVLEKARAAAFMLELDEREVAFQLAVTQADPKLDHLCVDCGSEISLIDILGANRRYSNKATSTGGLRPEHIVCDYEQKVNALLD